MQYLIYLLLTCSTVQAQDGYLMPVDTLVQNKIAQWRDLKFGLFMHWGTYSQWGVVESWSICPEDEGWTQRRGAYAATYQGYVKAYESLQNTFNPTDFNPDKWAAAAQEAGMRYVVFTTKHHDGFCMFDTKETEYKVTSAKTPFSSNPRSNVAKEVFDAFRKRKFLTGAYFSKPDWHSQNYWWPYFPPKDRNVNYDPKKYPERWDAFRKYTYNQINELMTGYGNMDILWLDGGWVRPLSSVDKTVDWQKSIVYDQDIDMKHIASMARSHQPGLIVVDRSVGGEFENYRTPEQEVPEKPLSYPWETCMTMGNSWSYVPGDHYKSAGDLIHLLIKIVSRGGNFLLNIGPGPSGDWDTAAYARLKDIGAWMKINSTGIYNTHPLTPYSSGKCVLTQSKDSRHIYVFLLGDEDNVTLPPQIGIDGLQISKKSIVALLGLKERIKYEQHGSKLVLIIPPKLRRSAICRYAATFDIYDAIDH